MSEARARPDEQRPPGQFRGGLAVFSGPSGSGKTSVCRALLQDPRVSLSVSATTRPPRPGEQDGVDYRFHSVDEFRRGIDDGAFVEWAEVYGNLYGTPRAPLLEASSRTDRLLLVDIDVQGARQLREQGIRGIFLFVSPPSLATLRERLEARGTDSQEVIERRLRVAAEEMACRHLYDHVLVNEVLDETVAEARRLLGLAPG